MGTTQLQESKRIISPWSASQRAALRRCLLRWYARNQRDLPWRRREGDGYAQMIAEFMLQQTQVARVVEYYHRFMQLFPSVHHLAKADLDQVLQLWAGLGYYGRARNLHRAAQQIVRDHSGRVPSNVHELEKLPGIGRYTAGAIASIAFDTRAPVLDGNVARVLLRLIGWEARADDSQMRQQLWKLADELLPKKKVGDFNQGLMELGASICSPKSPDCPACPLNRFCTAFAWDLVKRIPLPNARTRMLEMGVATAVLRCGKQLLFVQRPADGLWGGLWELPGETLNNGESPRTARNRLRKRLPADCRLATKPVTTVQRQLTHRQITFYLYQGTLKRPKLKHIENSLQTNGCRWISRDQVGELPISRACLALLQALDNALAISCNP